MARGPILILYTGGTIGMEPGPSGWQPAAGFDRQIRTAQMALGRQAVGLPDWSYTAMEPPIDSANMAQHHWLAMRDCIVQAVAAGQCGGVLVLHGTDTLAYTAAALGFLLLGLPVPVVITGAMRPAQMLDTDAWRNLFGALRHLGNGTAVGVQVFFHERLLPGSRVTKRFSDADDAFQCMRDTPALAPAALAHELTVPHDAAAAAAAAETVVTTMAAARSASLAATALRYDVERTEVSLAVVPVYPGLDARGLAGILQSGFAGVVLELYGTGTGPSDDAAFLDVLRQAHAQGVVLVGISQCPSGGMDAGHYAAGSRLLQTGVLPGGVMTREAALGKLFGLLGAGLDADAVAAWWPVNLCGELG